MEDIRDIVFLKGSQGTDSRDTFNELSKLYNCILFDNLYEKPDKMAALKFLKPECLHISTTGLFHEKIDFLVDVFSSLEWAPKYVIFEHERSVMALLELARELKGKGVRFFYVDGTEFDEIKWI
jgi:hypothetical protein